MKLAKKRLPEIKLCVNCACLSSKRAVSLLISTNNTQIHHSHEEFAQRDGFNYNMLLVPISCALPYAPYVFWFLLTTCAFVRPNSYNFAARAVLVRGR